MAGFIVKEIHQGVNAVEIKNEIDNIVNQIVDEIKELATDVSSEEQIKQVATISGNNDSEVGNLIAEAIDKVGRDGIVTIEESKSGETTLEVVEGSEGSDTLEKFCGVEFYPTLIIIEDNQINRYVGINEIKTL